MGSLSKKVSAIIEGGGRMTKGTLSPLTTNSQTIKIVKPKITGTTNLINRVSEAAEFAKTTFIRQATSQNKNAKITNVMTCPFD
jgi:hypothetical protein